MDTSADRVPEVLTQDRVYAFIKDAITSARFKPGHRLRTDSLAQAVKASRTPVREALGRLAQAGLVERDDGWGYVVKPVGVKDVLDMYSVREVLELQVARELVPKLTPRVVAALKLLNKGAEKLYLAKRYDGFLAQNRAFHIAMVRATGNALLEHMLDLINDRVRQIGSLIVLRYEPRTRELLLENRRIMAAIANRDMEELLAAIAEHVRCSREQFLRLLASPTTISMSVVRDANPRAQDRSRRGSSGLG